MYHFCLDWQNWTYSNHHKGVDFVLELLHVATLWKTCVNMHCANKGPSTRSDFSIILLRFIISLFVIMKLNVLFQIRTRCAAETPSIKCR